MTSIDRVSQVEIVFRNSSGKHPPLAVRWNIRKNILARQWLKLLECNILRGTHPIEKNYCLQGWQDTWDGDYNRNLKKVCALLNQSIFQINNSSLDYNIDLEFSVEKLRSSQYRTLMHDIHNHFAVLIGHTGEESKWWQVADHSTRDNIIKLNNYCHEIELTVQAIKNRYHSNILSFFRLGARPLSVFVSQNGKDNQGNYIRNRISRDITEEEFECFEYSDSWGDIELFYSQIGKPHRDVWLEDDKIIARSDINSTQFITGEFLINFNPLFGERKKYFPRKFCEWLTDNSFDIERKFGFAVVAEIDLSTRKEKIKLTKELVKRDDLFQISLLDNTGKVLIQKQFDYIWDSQQ